MIDHAFVVSLAGHTELVLVVSAVTCIVLRQNRILYILLVSYRAHKVVVLRDQATILRTTRRLSLLLSVCLRNRGIFTWLIYTFHILCNDVILGHLSRRLLGVSDVSSLLRVLIVSIERAMMRSNSHTHVVETYL